MGHINNETLELNSDGNATISINFFDERRTVISQWMVYSYFAFIFMGVAINVIHFVALLRCRKNGTCELPRIFLFALIHMLCFFKCYEAGLKMYFKQRMPKQMVKHNSLDKNQPSLKDNKTASSTFLGSLTIVMLLSMVDAVSSYVVVIEILTLNNKVWIFSSDNCPIFNATEVLVNALVIWIIICLNFQVISISNLHKNEVEKKNTNPLTNCPDESNECLVTKKENTNRTLNIDYRKKKSDISVTVPIILIIFVCFSLSIPNFALSSTLQGSNHTICAIMDHFYGYTLQKVLFICRILGPVVLLLFTLSILLIKLAQMSRKDIDNVLTQKCSEIRALLLCCIAVTILYIVTSFQRNILHFLHIISYDFDNTSMRVFKVPPFYNDKVNVSNGIYLSMLHYSGITCRAFLYFFILPKYQSLVRSRIFTCCKTAEK